MKCVFVIKLLISNSNLFSLKLYLNFLVVFEKNYLKSYRANSNKYKINRFLEMQISS